MPHLLCPWLMIFTASTARMHNSINICWLSYWLNLIDRVRYEIISDLIHFSQGLTLFVAKKKQPNHQVALRQYNKVQASLLGYTYWLNIFHSRFLATFYSFTKLPGHKTILRPKFIPLPQNTTIIHYCFISN